MTTRTQSKASQLNKSHAVRKSSRTHADIKEIFSRRPPHKPPKNKKGSEKSK